MNTAAKLDALMQACDELSECIDAAYAACDKAMLLLAEVKKELTAEPAP